MEERTIGLDPNAPPARTAPPRLAGRTARIRRPAAHPVERAGRARADAWRLTVGRQDLADRAEPEPAGTAGPPAPPRRPPPRITGRPGWTGAPDLPDLERALVNPAAVFASPAAVLAHPRLLRACKREILRRWAWDEYLQEVAAAEGMAEGEPSQLDAVQVALLALGETGRPHPAAPAAALPAAWEAGRAAA